MFMIVFQRFYFVLFFHVDKLKEDTGNVTEFQRLEWLSGQLDLLISMDISDQNDAFLKSVRWIIMRCSAVS